MYLKKQVKELNKNFNERNAVSAVKLIGYYDLKINMFMKNKLLDDI